MFHSRRYRDRLAPPQGAWWGEEDSNLRRRAPADLQSAPFDRSGISPALMRICLEIAEPQFREPPFSRVVIFENDAGIATKIS